MHPSKMSRISGPACLHSRSMFSADYNRRIRLLDLHQGYKVVSFEY
jgi:hypothetical protein